MVDRLRLEQVAGRRTRTSFRTHRSRVPTSRPVQKPSGPRPADDPPPGLCPPRAPRRPSSWDPVQLALTLDIHRSSDKAKDAASFQNHNIPFTIAVHDFTTTMVTFHLSLRIISAYLLPGPQSPFSTLRSPPSSLHRSPPRPPQRARLVSSFARRHPRRPLIFPPPRPARPAPSARRAGPCGGTSACRSFPPSRLAMHAPHSIVNLKQIEDASPAPSPWRPDTEAHARVLCCRRRRAALGRISGSWEALSGLRVSSGDSERMASVVLASKRPSLSLSHTTRRVRH